MNYHNDYFENVVITLGDKKFVLCDDDETSVERCAMCGRALSDYQVDIGELFCCKECEDAYYYLTEG